MTSFSNAVTSVNYWKQHIFLALTHKREKYDLPSSHGMNEIHLVSVPGSHYTSRAVRHQGLFERQVYWGIWINFLAETQKNLVSHQSTVCSECEGGTFFFFFLKSDPAPRCTDQRKIWKAIVNWAEWLLCISTDNRGKQNNCSFIIKKRLRVIDCGTRGSW